MIWQAVETFAIGGITMSRLRSRSWVLMMVVCSMLGAMGLAWGQQAATPEAPPPADQQYIGAKKCSACHFDQYLKWKKTKHATTFNLLPANFQADAKCLKCHTTGFGEPTGFKTVADKDLMGTSCEACHGPGSKHEEISKPFAKQKP